MKHKWKLILIIIVAITAIALMIFLGIQGTQNKAISLAESVYQASSDIKVQEKRRIDLVYNLADCVKQYDSHESKTLTSIADAMSKGNSVEDVSTSIAAIGYQYPQLQSNENYKQLMTELATTENLIAQCRENYNSSVTDYNRYVKKFPIRFFLSWIGYDVEQFERLDYDVSSDAPQDLFGE